MENLSITQVMGLVISGVILAGMLVVGAVAEYQEYKKQKEIIRKKGSANRKAKGMRIRNFSDKNNNLIF